jgi:hypothetical protein
VLATATIGPLACNRLQFGSTVGAAGAQAGCIRLPRRWLQSLRPTAARSPPAMTVAQITPPAPRTGALAGHAYCVPVVRELQQPVADPSADRTW